MSPHLQAICFLVSVIGTPLIVIGLVLFLGPRGTEMLLKPGQRWVRVPVRMLTPELQQHFRGYHTISADANRLVETPYGLAVSS